MVTGQVIQINFAAQRRPCQHESHSTIEALFKSMEWISSFTVYGNVEVVVRDSRIGSSEEGAVMTATETTAETMKADNQHCFENSGLL